MDETTQNLKIPATREAINTVPTTNGVYIFRKGDDILYIGKSVNLKARLLSHVENAKTDNKEAAIVNNADSIECIITDSEFKALLLESELIQTRKPKYNARWMDDKSYLYIKITTDEDYPKIFPVRRENNGTSTYFGPFPSIRSVQDILKEVRKVFPFCTQKKISKQPCFYAKIGQCAPCPNVIEYTEDPQEKQRLKRLYRHNIRQVIKVLEGNTDLVLKDLYSDLKKLTKEEKYEEALVVRNRISRLERLIHKDLGGPDTLQVYNQSEASMNQLREILIRFFPQLGELQRIECYDVSNLSQKEATASMVVATNGLIDKKEYRKFKIKNTKLQSDFEMMDEIMRRRFNNKWPQPDLIIIDGGKPQLRFVQHALSQINNTTPFVGIAKNPDRLVIGIPDLPTIRPSIHHLGFNLVRALRDEAHRFAKKYHTYLRDKKIMEQ